MRLCGFLDDRYTAKSIMASNACSLYHGVLKVPETMGTTSAPMHASQGQLFQRPARQSRKSAFATKEKNVSRAARPKTPSSTSLVRNRLCACVSSLSGKSSDLSNQIGRASCRERV